MFFAFRQFAVKEVFCLLSALFSAISHLFCVVLGVGTPQNFPPPLSSTEEQHYFALLRANGDEEARSRLILHNLRLVAHIVRKYYAGNRNQEDLISIGTIGLVKAIDTFNPDNGAHFATYGAKCVQNEILMHFRSGKKSACEVSINDTIDIDRDGNPLTYIDVISSDDNMVEEIDRKLMTDRAMRLLSGLLEERERQVLLLRYGLCGMPAMTQREIAKRLGISRSYVSRIEKSALEKLRAALLG